MRAGRVTVSTRRFEMTEIPIPNPPAGYVRIAVKAAGVCLSDVHFMSGIISPAYLDGDVVTLGHEVSGVIDELGDGVHTWKAGDEVIVCAGGRDELGRIHTQGFDYDGGFADYLIIKAGLLVKKPQNITFEEAAIIPDAVSTPWAAITTTAKIQNGESVAVFGIGGLGIHAIQLLKIVGASPVVAIDPMPEARARALKVGADYAFDPQDPDIKKLKGFDAIFDFAGATPVRKQSLSLLREGGRLVLVGIANEPITIPSDMAFIYMRTQIMGHFGSDITHTAELAEMAGKGILDLSGSISEVIALADAPLALEKLEKKIGNPIRIVLRP
jgi:D-arabinose 1-dehydrogenase-like Zn-dependent alcohol dehydrogenase